MKTITVKDVRKLREETGEGLLACKKILEERYAAEEKAEMLSKVRELSFLDRRSETLVKEILTYLVRNS